MELDNEVIKMSKMYKKVTKYFKDHPNYNSFVHIFAGIAVGIMMTYPFVGEHPVRWAAGFLGLAVLAHLYPLFAK